MSSSDDRLGDTAADADSALSLSPRARKIAFAVIATGMLLAALDSTIVATALPTIVGDLGGSQQLSWVVTIYLLTEAVATALAGKLGDIFGRRTLFLVAVVVFVGGSAAAGAAGTITWLIVARAVQGLGAGGLMVTATAMIADIIPVRQRGAYQGALGAVFGVTTVIGPLLGGLFTEHLSWRWAFYVNVPLAAVMIVVAIKVLPATTARSRPVIDYLGIGFISTAASLLILALHWGGHDYAWTSPTIVLMLAGAALALGAFVLAERRAAEPIMPLRLFRSNVFTVSSVLSFIVGFALVGTMTYLPSFLQFCLGTSPTESGLRTLPMVAGLLVASLASGAAVSRTGRYKAFPVAGALVMAVGIVLLARLSERSGFVDSSLAMLVLGVGIGLSMQILVLIVQNTVDYADLGVATSAVSFFRTLGSSFGAAIFGTLYSSEVADRLPEALAATGTAPEAATSPDAVALLPDAAQAVVRAAYADALQDVFMAGLPLAALALLFALALRQVPMRDIVQPSAGNVGEGFGMPEQRSSADLLATLVSRAWRTPPIVGLLQQRFDDPGQGAQQWLVTQVAASQTRSRTFASLSDIAHRHRMPAGVLRPLLDQAIVAGAVQESPEGLSLTERGFADFRALLHEVTQLLVDEVESQTGESLDEEARQQIGPIAWEVAVHIAP